MGQGTAIAKEVADITLSEGDLHSLVQMRMLSRGLMGRMDASFAQTIAFNSALLALGIGGIITPQTSSLLHNASTIALSMHSSRAYNLLELRLCALPIVRWLGYRRRGREPAKASPSLCLRRKDGMNVTIYTDGSSRGNPGPGGYGAVLQFVDSTGKLHERELSQGYATTTNNRMELLGVIVALEALKRPCTVEVHSDSQYVVNAFNQHWVDGWLKRGWKNAKKEPVKNSDLWKRLLEAKKPHDVTFVWVKGHAGHPENERCDALATAAADGKKPSRGYRLYLLVQVGAVAAQLDPGCVLGEQVRVERHEVAVRHRGDVVDHDLVRLCRAHVALTRDRTRLSCEIIDMVPEYR